MGVNSHVRMFLSSTPILASPRQEERKRNGIAIRLQSISLLLLIFGILSIRVAHANPYLAKPGDTPIKARVLLMVALTKTTDRNELQRIFSEY